MPKTSKFDPVKFAEGLALELPGANITSVQINPNYTCLVHLYDVPEYHNELYWIDGKFYGGKVEYSLEWDVANEKWLCITLTSCEDYRAQCKSCEPCKRELSYV